MSGRLTRSIWLPWVMRARLQQRRVWQQAAPREEFVRRYTPACSFADIGAMWNVHGQMAFLAEECGARSVTAMDVMPATDTYEAEHARRSSEVRFIRGDVHDPDVIRQVGPHQVVWCSGLLYHAPNPLLTLERLQALTTDVLILATETIPEVPGLDQACVFLPGLSAQDRKLHAAAHPGGLALGIHTAFERSQGYGAWWWGITRSALRGMLHATGFELREEHGGPLHTTVIATPRELG